jgi:hypothetical protein
MVLQQAATTALGGLSLQEPEVDPKLLVKRGVRAIDWRRGVLRLSTHALQHALHQASGGEQALTGASCRVWWRRRLPLKCRPPL